MFWPKPYLGFVSLWLLLCLFHSPSVAAFVVPSELISVLSLIYSNIPPIKKGTDSRLGFGFRLGPHADFQVLLELGPQKETRKLGDPDKNQGESFNKRQVSHSELQRQALKQHFLTSTERTTASWLETWSNGMKPLEKSKIKGKVDESTKPALPMPADATQQLQQLYKMASNSMSSSSSSTTTTTSESPPPRAESLYLTPSGFKLPPPALAQDFNYLGNSTPKRSSAEITKELMNVSLEA